MADSLPDSGSNTRDLGTSGIRGLFARAFGQSNTTDDLLVTVGDALFGEAPRLGRYRLGAQLGAGGFGIVRSAWDPLLQRNVAIKLVRRRNSGTRGRLTSLAREAQSLARVRHPNVVEVFDVGVADDGVFLVMQLVEGESLATWRNGRARSIAEILEVFRQAAAGLATIHAAGLLHRDFKPANVLIAEDGTVKIVDFGLAALLADDDDLTTGDGREEVTDERRLHAAGTPMYMAPEQHQGRRLDARADVYAFALVLLETLLGRYPFRISSLATLVRTKLAEDFDDPEELGGLPPAIVRALAWGLRADPRKRCPNIAKLLEAFEARSDRKRPVRLAGAVGAAALLLFATAPALGSAPCDGATMPSMWTTARERLATKLGAGPVEDAIVARTDDWGARWLAARSTVCAAPVVERCLDHELVDFVAGLDALPTERPDALTAVAEVPDPSHCLGATEDPVALDDELRARVDMARVHARTGDLDALADDVAAIGDQLDGAPQQLATLEHWRSILARQRHDTAAERAHLERAYELARSARSDDLAHRAALQLAASHAIISLDDERSRHWLRIADAIAPVELGAMMQGRRAHLEVRLATRTGEYARAVELGEQALVELEAAGLVRTPLAVEIRNGVIESEVALGSFDGLEPRARAALDAAIELRGPDSYIAARARATLGRLLVSIDRLDEAALELARARDTLLAQGEPLLLGQVYNSLAHVAAAKGDMPAAIASYRAAYDVMQPDEKADRGITLVNLAAAEISAGLDDDGEAHLDRGVELLEGTLDDRHPWRVHVDDERAKIAMHRGAWAEAARRSESVALGYAKHYGETSWMAADAWLNVAKARLEQHDAEGALAALAGAAKVEGAPDSLLVALDLCRARALAGQRRASEATAALAHARDRFAGLERVAADNLRGDLAAAEKIVDAL